MTRSKNLKQPSTDWSNCRSSYALATVRTDGIPFKQRLHTRTNVGGCIMSPNLNRRSNMDENLRNVNLRTRFVPCIAVST